MRRIAATAATAALALSLAGCQVNVDNNTEASLSNAADTVEAVAGNAADAAGNLAERGAAKVENAADAIGNTDLHVNVQSDTNASSDADNSAATNSAEAHRR